MHEAGEMVEAAVASRKLGRCKSSRGKQKAGEGGG